MNALDEKLQPRAGRLRPLGGVMALLILGGGQSAGCADIRRATSLPPVNPESPVAGVVAAAAMQSFKRPSLASVPPKPLNIPPPDAVKTAVIDMVRCRRAYEVWAAAHPPEVSGTGAFAETLQARLDNNPEDRPTPEDKAAAEAEAAKLRAYAEPPPALPTGPPLSASQAAAPGATAAPGPRRAAPAKLAAAASAPAPSVAPARPPAASVPAASSATPASQAPATSQAVAAVRPSMAPLYDDPLLAHCQGVGL